MTLSTSNTGIVNAALVYLGEALIISLDDPVKTAQVAKTVFDGIYAQELRNHPWNFAMRRASLGAELAAPAFGYSYAYKLPTACVRLARIRFQYVSFSRQRFIDGEEAIFSLEGRYILTNEKAPLKIHYIAIPDSITDIDPLFEDLLGIALAVNMGESLTRNENKLDRLNKQYQDAYKKAVRVNNSEMPSQPIPDDTWVASFAGAP